MLLACGDANTVSDTTVVVSGKGSYSGTKSETFVIKAASIKKATVSGIKSMTYNGSAQEQSPTLTFGMQTLKEGTDYTLSYRLNTNAGTSVVAIAGEGNFTGSVMETFSIAKAASSISLEDQTLVYTGKALAYTGEVSKSGSAGKVTYAYYSDSNCKKQVKASAVKAAGTYYVKATLASDANYKAATSVAAKLIVDKAANPMDVAGKTVSVKYSKKLRALKGSGLYNFKKAAVGTVTYARVASGSSKYLSKVYKKTGNIAVEAGAPKGKTYKVKVKLTAKGDANHKTLSKTVAVKVKVK